MFKLTIILFLDQTVEVQINLANFPEAHGSWAEFYILTPTVSQWIPAVFQALYMILLM